MTTLPEVLADLTAVRADSPVVVILRPRVAVTSEELHRFNELLEVAKERGDFPAGVSFLCIGSEVDVMVVGEAEFRESVNLTP